MYVYYECILPASPQMLRIKSLPALNKLCRVIRTCHQTIFKAVCVEQDYSTTHTLIDPGKSRWLRKLLYYRPLYSSFIDDNKCQYLTMWLSNMPSDITHVFLLRNQDIITSQEDHLFHSTFMETFQSPTFAVNLRTVSAQKPLRRTRLSWKRPTKGKLRNSSTHLHISC